MKLRINSKINNIWRYANYYSPKIKSKFWLTLGEGWTANQKVNGFILKREDQNPTGSIKDRGLAFQITLAKKNQKKSLALSSSGNAAISAAAYCQEAKIKLFAFLSKKISPKKLTKIKKFQPYRIFLTPNPIKKCRQFCRKNKINDIRPSADKEAPEGFKSLAFEIHETLGKVDRIFIPVSSGATFVGIARGYRILKYYPKLYAVQTTTHCPIAKIFESSFKKEARSLATAICLKKTKRKKKILFFLKKSKGRGVVISNTQIRQAQKQLKLKKISTSAEGCAAFAAAQKIIARKTRTVCLLTGKKYDSF